jgi:CubicO group peptidase (beta-lactamase class C family)
MISRRAFTAGALSAAAALPLSVRARAQGTAAPGPALNLALAAIAEHAEAHRRSVGLPGLTLGLSLPDGTSRTLNFGFADLEACTTIGPDTLFQVGSISKLMNAALLQQLAVEGRFALTDRISTLLPDLTLPPNNNIQVQHVLDHVAGVPADAPVRPEGGLWTAFPPGQHWHYSNTGYVILGMLAEKAGGKPLAELLEERIFRPLGMSRSLGAIRLADRARYARGYQPAEGMPFIPAEPLAPARWIDEDDAAGGVASTADDMNRLMRSLAGAAQGRGGLGLPPALARVFTMHAVPSDVPGMTYGNGLMHVGNAGRSYFHHTGGMVGFSSSFHLDTASGSAAFASANIGFLAEYRPRLLTRFAVDALTNALAGHAPPPAPPVYPVLPVPAAYAGRFTGPAGRFDVRATGSALAIVSGGQSAELMPAGGDLFHTAHPAFRRFSLLFERHGNTIGGASWGPLSFVRTGSGARLPIADPKLATLSGTFVNDSPWFGTQHVVERGGRLWIGTEVPLIPAGDNLWRIGDEPWTPERASFADFAGGRPQSFIWSGEKFARADG